MSLAVFAAAVALVVYLRTLLPDLGGYEDTPKFQYLGAVLGTAHAPGYPLHTLLSYLFSLIPFGNHAYRVNLLSAASAAATVGLVVLTARTLGLSRLASLSAALVLAFGFAFWTFAVLAEVYSLAAFLLLAVLYWLIRWHVSGRPVHLFAASACFALALGNHVTVGVSAPAIAAFVLMSPARRTLRLTTMLAAGGVAASGFLQYLYLVVRTFQNAPLVEARVGSWADFVGLFRAERYESFLVPFTWDSFWSTVLPNLGWQARLEFGLAGLAVAAVGAYGLMRLEAAVSVLLGLTAGATAWLMTHFLGHQQGFLVPVWAIVAIFLATGMHVLERALMRALPRAPVLALAVGVTALVAWPLVPLIRNFDANDWSGRTGDAAFLRAAVASLPAPAALVREGYVVDSMLRYLEAIEGGSKWAALDRPPPDAAAILDLHERGVPVFALDGAYAELSIQGLDFQPVELAGPTLTEQVLDLPADAVLAVAARHAPVPVELARVLNLSRSMHQAWPKPYQVLMARPGAAPEFADDERDVGAAIDVGPGARRRTLSAVSGPDGAFIRLNERILAGTLDGLIAVAVAGDGTVLATHRVAPSDHRIPLAGPRRLYRLAGSLASLPVGGDTWQDITPVARDGAIDVLVNNYRAFDARITIYAVSGMPLRPSPDGRRSGAAEPAFHAHVFDRQDRASRAALDRWLEVDGLRPGMLGRSRFVARIRQTVNDGGEWSAWGLLFGALPDRVLVRAVTDLSNPRRVLVSAQPARRLPPPGDLVIINADGGSDRLFGPGWHRPEPDDAGGEFRWSSSEEAYVFLPLDSAAGIRLAATVMPHGRGAALGASANGRDLGACRLSRGWQSCVWTIPAASLRQGSNVVVLRSPTVIRPVDVDGHGDSRPLGIALRQIVLSRAPECPCPSPEMGSGRRGHVEPGADR